MSKNVSLKNLPIKVFDINAASSNMNISEVFAESPCSYLNEFKVFLAYFNTIPNLIIEEEIDCRRANKWFIENYKDDITDLYYSKRLISRNSKVAEFDIVFYFLYEDLIVDFDTSGSAVTFLFRKTDIDKVDILINRIKKFKVRKKIGKPKMLLLVNTSSGIGTKSFEISIPNLNIDENYNNDFKEIHEIIFKRLSKKNDKGLVLLHGKPGTGKTSYIRYLISILKKNVIFLPPNMVNAITNPNLISTLINNSNSVLVIEDAENIVFDRENDGNSAVSALLNTSDGLLSDCLNVQIICSFNTDISKVDTALVRKGRLIAKYEFKELEVTKANILSQKLGFTTVFNAPTALTAVYNQGEKDFQQNLNYDRIGFKSISSR
jgi:ATPase family associated with various cellular activities (AAA)